MLDSIVIRDQYIIKYSDNNSLGQGSIGEVYICRRKDGSDDSLCVKIVQKDKTIIKQLKQGVEIQKLLINLQTERLVRIENYLNLPHQIEIIMERCDMDLQKEFQILLKQKQWYNLNECLNIIHQIAEGCRILYEHKIIHRDIKPPNILVKVKNMKQINERRLYKIADFDFSKIVDTLDQNQIQACTSIGTLCYSSPQVYQQESYSGKCDIFSYGMLFYQVFFKGDLPLFQNKPKKSFNEIMNEDVRIFLEEIKTQKFKCCLPDYDRAQEMADLLEKMIVYEEEERISFDQFFLHPIVNLEEYEISKIQTIQFRKYQFYTSIWQKYKNENDIYIMTSVLCLQLLGYQELLYCMGFIHCIITDIHPSYKLNKDITTIQRILQQCAKDINLYPMYEEQTKKIRKQYFQMKEVLPQQKELLRQELIGFPDNNKIKSEIKQIQKKDERIQPHLIFDTLRSLLDQNLYEDLKSDIRKVFQYQEKYPFEKYREINADEIFNKDK